MDENDRNQIALELLLHSVRHDLDTFEPRIFDSSVDWLRPLCFMFPHGGIKEIRFAVWLISIIIAEHYGIEALWSTDSDSVVLPCTAEKTLQTLLGDTKIGGAGATVGIGNRDLSWATELASGYFISSVYLDRAMPASFGKSHCLPGPAAAYRIAALRQVLVPWYRQQVFGFKRVSNNKSKPPFQIQSEPIPPLDRVLSL